MEITFKSFDTEYPKEDEWVCFIIPDGKMFIGRLVEIVGKNYLAAGNVDTGFLYPDCIFPVKDLYWRSTGYSYDRNNNKAVFGKNIIRIWRREKTELYEVDQSSKRLNPVPGSKVQISEIFKENYNIDFIYNTISKEIKEIEQWFELGVGGITTKAGFKEKFKAYKDKFRGFYAGFNFKEDFERQYFDKHMVKNG